ncbi:MAG: bifunctional DNA-formamidopyrimidine glycosylase/DNA-(apurinic or apyrimidinic site) lyase [Candidatus Tectomicrobia bacterium]|uniref:Formamidopyrimidine-DNA glycosylase n=1 Tax=Tectimicrobiota bacterium TaxID=2528274 RepID=A0A932GN32_UNCTE|nr:bifunctional DNA-formamidopyrimidine glycosylase/DNA-(apurinic or apyrimidinic site) lyase [Candidatus Tectomicrobia bacterium]
MPELPEVETVRRTLLPLVTGRKIMGLTVLQRELRRPVHPSRLKRQVVGRRLETVERRGKYLLFSLNSPQVLVLHLGMTGRLRVVSSQAPVHPYDCLLFHLSGGKDLRYEDKRRFGLVFAASGKTLARDPSFRNMGPEPLGDSMPEDYLWVRSRGRHLPVKNFLMDGRVIAGIGNIYANEALFAARIRPNRAVSRLSKATFARLTESLRAILRDAIAQRGTSFSDYRDGNGQPGDFQIRLRVYGKEGKPCSNCSTRIRRIVQAGRSSFFCPFCQR